MSLSDALIVFDLDGTLIDSRRDLAESVSEMLVSYGADPLGVEQVAAMVGDGARMLVERALAASGLATDTGEALLRFLAAYDRRLLVHTLPFTGLPEIVERMASLAPLALLTNKPEAPSRRILDAFGFTRHFRWVVGGDSGFPRKPDPAGLRHLVAEAGSTPARTLLIGDTMVDIETARRAATGICVALYGFGRAREDLALDGVELVARTPAEVGQVIEGFLQRPRDGALPAG